MNARNPYSDAPDRAFWSRAVAKGWRARELVFEGEPLIFARDRIVSAGSCFAANIVPWLEAAGYAYIRTESNPFPDEGERRDRFGYFRYSAAYGNIYTPRQLLQLLRRACGRFKPVEDRWITGEGVVDPFRPGLPYPAECGEEFDLLTEAHLDRTREAFATADVFLFTLGLTECWLSTLDGAVFPACPGTIAGEFDPQRHVFKNFTVAEAIVDMDAFIGELRAINPATRVILTVSPVPLVATATGRHVALANTYSKSVLRVACEEIESRHPNVRYFPAYEIVMGGDSTEAFEADRRNVSEAGVAAVADALIAHCERPAPREPHMASAAPDAGALSQALARYECEETMLDPASGGQSSGASTARPPGKSATEFPKP